MCTQKKERDEMTGHEASEDMKGKKTKRSVSREKDEKGKPDGGDGNR